MSTRALSFLWSGIRKNAVKRSKVSSPPGCNSAAKEKPAHCSLCTQTPAVLFAAALFKRAISGYKSIPHIPGKKKKKTGKCLVSCLIYCKSRS